MLARKADARAYIKDVVCLLYRWGEPRRGGFGGGGGRDAEREEEVSGAEGGFIATRQCLGSKGVGGGGCAQRAGVRVETQEGLTPGWTPDGTRRVEGRLRSSAGCEGGGCQSGRDETWRRITSDNDGNAKMQCTFSSTAALGRDGARRQIMRCYRARASAVRRSGGAKDGVVARLVFRTLFCPSWYLVTKHRGVSGGRFGGGVMQKKGKKKRGDPSNSIPGVEGAPRPPHRLFLAPLSPVAVDDPWLADPCPLSRRVPSRRIATAESRPSGSLPRRASSQEIRRRTIRRRCAFLCCDGILRVTNGHITLPPKAQAYIHSRCARHPRHRVP